MIQDTVKDRFDAVRGLSSEDILAALGLQRKRSALDVILPAAGVFAAGIVVGTGVALLLAPKSGREMRRNIKGKATELTHRIGASAEEMAQEVRQALTSGDDNVPSRGHENGIRAEHKPTESAGRSTAAQK
jgi:hypothetical protein